MKEYMKGLEVKPEKSTDKFEFELTEYGQVILVILIVFFILLFLFRIYRKRS